jgi:hypothetical protein
MQPGTEDWEAPDGTRWFYFPPWREWTGWMPHEDGHWQLSVDDFRRSYPDAPPWDGWEQNT